MAGNEMRKLAAVMFADIEGYTSSFQQNETVAIHQVEDHRKDLESITATHAGKIIQFYGDGSVTVFDSTIAAIQCAIELQLSSMHHRIPVRIGIHMGDLVMKDGDIYGDVVNVASRIQSLGVVGSVLVSGKVVQEIGNHPEIHVTSLGLHALKNVKSKIEIFALTGNGLVVPGVGQTSGQKKFVFSTATIWMVILISALALGGYFWMKSRSTFNKVDFEKGTLIIPTFIDRTETPAYAYIGEYAASYLSTMMSDGGLTNVMSFESSLRYTNTDLASIINNPALARRTGADYMLVGNYALKGSHSDSLRFYASIIDVRTSKNLNFPISNIVCASNNPEAGINQILNILKGYYKTFNSNLLHPTNNKAFIAYQKAITMWADPNFTAKARSYLLEAIHADSTFLDAYFLLMEGMNNAQEYKNEADTIELIKNRFQEMSERDQSNFLFYEADLKGHTLDAFKYLRKEYDQKPDDLLLNTSGMVMAIDYLNDPKTAHMFNQDINIDSLDLNACVYCHQRCIMAMVAYMQLNKLDSAGLLADRMKPYVKDQGQIKRMLSYYIQVGDTLSINYLIQKGVALSKVKDLEYRYDLVVARLAKVYAKNTLVDQYANKVITYYNHQQATPLARCYMLTNELDKAEKIFLQNIKENPEDNWLYADLGVVYAKKGNVTMSNKMIAKLQELREDYQFGLTPYFQGRIKANLGETTEALDYLTIAFEEGIKFLPATTFQEDPDMAVLNSNPDYQKLLIQNRQPQ